jgi:glycosyltransferase involved in cell wall biosynthesis
MLVSEAWADDWTVQGPGTRIGRFAPRLRNGLSQLCARVLNPGHAGLQSAAWVPSRWAAVLNKSDADVVHLHWINNEMMSITDIGKLQKPVVWTLHDMWAFCGAEHYTQNLRWKEGYSRRNCPPSETGFDLNRWTWRRKVKHWRRPIQVVTPSVWLQKCVKESVLMRDWPVTVVPNTIDTNKWSPIERTLARRLLGLPSDARLLVFVAFGGANDQRKGFDLLANALPYLGLELLGFELVVVGQMAPREPLDLGFPVRYLGHLHDDISLRLTYSAADGVVIPSRCENLPNIGLEANACGTPVIAFNVGGLPELVQQQKTGYLAKPFDLVDLATGIRWVIEDSTRNATLGIAARKRAVEKWSYAVVASAYKAVYEKAVRRHSRLAAVDDPLSA